MSSTDNQTAPLRRQINARQEEFFLAHGLGTLLLRPPKRVVHPYAWLGHFPFAQTLMRIMRPRTVVELGTHTGNSFSCFCQAVVENGLDARCYAVDTWWGDAQAGYYGDSVYEELAQHVQGAFGGCAELLRMTFDEAADHFENGSVDLLHIDGLHTYEAVRHDYVTWKEKLSPSGVVLFHDTNVFDRDFGVHRLWAELRREYPSFEFLHSHGLGVLLVGSEASQAISEFVDLANEDPEPIRLLFERASQVWLSGDAQAYQLRFGTDPMPSTGADSLDCELYLDRGQGFSESEKLIGRMHLEEGRGRIDFDLQRFSKGLVGLRFDPGSEPIALSGLRAQVRDSSGLWTKLDRRRDDSIHSDQGVVLFPADPWVDFSLGEGDFCSIEIELEVIAVGSTLTDIVIERIEFLMRPQAPAGESDAEIQKLWRELDAKDSLVEGLQAQIEEKDAAAQKLWDDVASKDSTIEGLKVQMGEKEAEARKLWSDLAVKDSLISGLQEDLDRMRSHPAYPVLLKMGLIPIASNTSEKQ